MWPLSKISESYTIRHKLLEVLYNEDKINPGQPFGSILLNKRTNISIEQIEKCSTLLLNENEITSSNKDDQLFITLTSRGSAAFIDNKYKKEKNTAIRTNLYYWVNIVGPILAIILSIIVLFLNHSLNNRVDKLEQDFQLLKNIKK